jgi:hypothetical protein
MKIFNSYCICVLFFTFSVTVCHSQSDFLKNLNHFITTDSNFDKIESMSMTGKSYISTLNVPLLKANGESIKEGEVNRAARYFYKKGKIRMEAYSKFGSSNQLPDFIAGKPTEIMIYDGETTTYMSLDDADLRYAVVVYQNQLKTDKFLMNLTDYFLMPYEFLNDVMARGVYSERTVHLGDFTKRMLDVASLGESLQLLSTSTSEDSDVEFRVPWQGKQDQYIDVTWSSQYMMPLGYSKIRSRNGMVVVAEEYEVLEVATAGLPNGGVIPYASKAEKSFWKKGELEGCEILTIDAIEFNREIDDALFIPDLSLAKRIVDISTGYTIELDQDGNVIKQTRKERRNVK